MYMYTHMFYLELEYYYVCVNFVFRSSNQKGGRLLSWWRQGRRMPLSLSPLMTEEEEGLPLGARQGQRAGREMNTYQLVSSYIYTMEKSVAFSA